MAKLRPSKYRDMFTEVFMMDDNAVLEFETDLTRAAISSGLYREIGIHNDVVDSQDQFDYHLEITKDEQTNLVSITKHKHKKFQFTVKVAE